jgi:uncharacterized protein
LRTADVILFAASAFGGMKQAKTRNIGYHCTMFYRPLLQMKKQLKQVGSWLDKAVAFGAARKFDPDSLLTARLSPDQFPLIKQIQVVCDTVKLGTSRLTGKEAPKHEDNEKTIAELRVRIASVIEYLDSVTEADFSDTAGRAISQPRWEGKTMTGADYFFEHFMPNFYFHLAHVYALLRHNGVDVGKRDYLGALTMQAPKA